MPPGASCGVRLYAHATPEQARCIRDRARSRCLTVSQYLVLAGTARHIPMPPVSAIDMAAVGQLSRVGNNLNQAVHLLHTGVLDPGFRPVLEELRALLTELRRRLLRIPPEGSGA